MTGHNSQHTQHAGRTAPHNQVRNQNHGSQRDNRGRRDPRSFDSSTHHRIGGEDRRYRDGRDEFRFEGYWFTCDFYPSWVFEEDVYVVMGPSDVWFVYQYGNPAFMVQVRLVE
jgi:hypothetical protein